MNLQINTVDTGNILPHEKTAMQSMPISLGSFLVTRVPFRILNKDYFIRHCNFLANMKSLLPSEVAYMICMHFKLSASTEYSNLTGLVENWKNNVK